MFRINYEYRIYTNQDNRCFSFADCISEWRITFSTTFADEVVSDVFSEEFSEHSSDFFI